MLEDLILRIGVRAPDDALLAEESVADANVHTLGTMTRGRLYGLRIVPATDGATVIGHYRCDGVSPDQNDCPITGTDGEHPIIILADTASCKIIRDSHITNNFYAYHYPLTSL